MSKPSNTPAAVIAALVIVAGAAGVAHASDDDGAYRSVSSASGSSTATDVLPMTEVLARLHEAGYTDIREIERERGVYEIKGRDAEGHRIELYVDARTGEVLKQERDD